MNTASIRTPAVAGMFYPGSSAALRHALDSAFADTRPCASSRVPKALIVPHAGYIYSGAIAASAYDCIRPAHHRITRVVLLGPSHRVALDGLALPTAGRFATPLGLVEVDHEAASELAGLSQVSIRDDAHAHEHALEVQLPFLQSVLDRFTLVPLSVGQASERDVAEVIDRLWGGPETLIVISSDLSHYHPYGVARRLDQATADQIVALQPLADYDQACGAIPVNGLLACARTRALAAQLLDLRNSGDTAGDKSRVVGYGAFALREADKENPDGN